MILSLRDFAVGYEKWPVIEGVALDVAPGGITAVVGPNAAGKTSLFRGLFCHRGVWLKGRILWNDVPVPHLRAPQVTPSQISWVRQDRPIFPDFSIVDALSVAAASKARPVAEAVDSVLERVPYVKTVLKQTMRTLSGGQRTLVSLAMGLINEPRLLCLDEPAAGLDRDTSLILQQTLLKYVQPMSAGCLIIEHRDEFINEIATSQIRINQAM